MICPCRGCTRRTAMPNCHATCEEYLAWAKTKQLAREARELDRIGDDARIRQLEIRRKNQFKKRRV